MTRFYITTPIYYVNDAPHVGHAYTTVACDVLARFMRLDGREVFFLTGTDEHGQKVEKAAREAGLPPQEFTDRVARNFRDLARELDVSNDDFIRTTEARHAECCREMWRRMAASKSPKGRDNVYLGKYAGWYAVRDEAFYGEDELSTGPDGRKRAPSGAEVEWVEEPSYFFRLSDWRDWLLAYYERERRFIAPETRRNEILGFLNLPQGLTDLSISRTTFRWGVKVPGDDAHIMYVWLDALANYVSATGWPANEKDPAGRYAKFWPADLHMVGKDIIRFHTVYWPAFLAAAGLAPPRRVFAHGWWTVEGQKMSKSLGNVIKPADMIAKYGLDPLRYFLLREVPFGQDGDFSQAAIARRINTDLANDLGNLAQRVLSFIQKNAGGVVPRPGALAAEDRALLDGAAALLPRLRAELAEQAFHKALEAVFAVVADANRYVDAQAPWTLRKSDPARMETVLHVLAETIRRVAIPLQPFMPGSMARLLDQLAVPADARGFAAIDRALEPGTKLPPPSGIFPRHGEKAA